MIILTNMKKSNSKFSNSACVLSQLIVENFIIRGGSQKDGPLNMIPVLCFLGELYISVCTRFSMVALEKFVVTLQP